MSLQQTFIANLRYFRKKKGLTQKDLSVYLNKGYNYINCIEGGNSFPPPDVIDQMAAILEVEPGLLFQKDSSTWRRTAVRGGGHRSDCGPTAGGGVP